MARFRARSDERARQRPAVKCIRCEMSYLAATTILPEAMLDVQDQCNESNVLNASASPLDCPEVSYTPYGQRVETYVVPVVFACILVVGVLGNTVLIITICRHATMRNVPNTYVLSLAIGDLLVILICVPFTFAVYVLDSWPFGLALCRLSEFAKDVSVGVSVFTLTALSADRFFAIVDPMRKLHATGSGKRAKWFTKIVAFLIWMLATFCAIPATFSYIRVFKVNKNVTFLTCYPFPDQFGPNYPKTVVICRFCIFYVVPLSIIAVFYILMARHLMQSTRNIPGEKQGQAKQVKARKKVAKMVIAFVAVFAICFLPQHVFMLWFYSDPDAQENYNAFWHCFRILGFCLAFMNSCINPIALYCVSGTFRKYFNRYLLCCCCWSARRAVSLSSLNRRGQSFSFTTSRRHTSSRRGGAHSVVHMASWQPGNVVEMTSRERSTPQEPETTVTVFQNGHEQRI
ncbi:neuropeptide CCHamide-1 receptor-like isoform X1 [Phymastichus coffea]|uniref:neuropeptide CCHamide-1 receptor-like isoform X1 n=1 Tax=Phymastichus coffea TaxID=108790 RepID=UPI00273CE5FA|nr:neuropeptide CCHamide-1 receptor-like isoform X1 [Phymastichus coffea]XP_058794039.1 neuropeptide CCHamide-1 receptor-like isoform X1 [Phymastichus coffea]XP_058794040.1 neuropeptide CCHamide-1 receptor-like isoform X1 [Phymastichus coffea]XP_058794041.1 neuropeptide CCHamide-1 receptor-like isoform X1 [Phymastichus coffea]XP_058794042.1 neuropeptide CCHamide-1 receptor-like isoform X1 [Phymastichus coffea]XP_058794043.1 neuropeptide CCHamide-1 receptor-like isoform X1 [Phymastichus coffea]